MISPRTEFRCGREFPHPSRPVLGFTLPPLKGYQVSFPVMKRPGRCIDHPLPIMKAGIKEKRYIELCAITVSIHITITKCNTLYQEAIPTAYGFVNGLNRGYKLCPTFCSRIRLNISGITLPKQGFRALGDRKIHTGNSTSFSSMIFNY
jgi:hypothetical protein